MEYVTGNGNCAIECVPGAVASFVLGCPALVVPDRSKTPPFVINFLITPGKEQKRSNPPLKQRLILD